MTFLQMICNLALLVLTTHALTDAEIALFTHKTNSKHITVTKSGSNLVVTSTSWPDHDTKQYNPHAPGEQNFKYTINNNPAVPSSSAKGKCLPMGPIGFAINGVAIFSPYTAEDTNAGECEKFDSCDGHADPQKTYHYHKGASCVVKKSKDKFIGVAMDGYPIYSAPANFSLSTLDDCHGQNFTDKSGTGRYRYISTETYPYFLGCFKGVPVDTKITNPRGQCKFAKDLKDTTACAATGVSANKYISVAIVILLGVLHKYKCTPFFISYRKSY